MKNIGIKLADGTFYPVLQDNVPSEKALKLTTAHNNQTKVMVDLYRSETDSMKDAEYVDSLQIESLIAHPNGEPDIAFSISLDEENQLSARIVDEETGKQSNTTITLVSRTIEERLYTDEYDIKDLELPAKRKGLLATASALLGTGAVAETTAAKEIKSEEIEEDPIVIEEPAPTDEETFVEEPSLDDFNLGIPDEELESENETIIAEEPAVEPAMDLDLPDFDETPFEETAPTEVTETTEVAPESVEETISEPAAESAMDFDLPDFDETPFEETAPAEVTETTEAAEDQTVYEETPMFTPSEDIGNMDIDFTIPVTPTAVNSLDSYEFNIDKEDDLDLNDMDLDFDFPEVEDKSSVEDVFSIPEPEIQEADMSKKSYTESHSSGGISFTGLYDKETELGTSGATEENSNKKTKAPVIICIICAIICLLATAVVLLIVPSKFNLLGKKGDETTVVIEKPAPIPEPAPAPEPEPVVEPEPEPEVEEVVIIEKAEEVIPEQPPVAEEKPKDITYKIKWGDTLWDISDTYYKNPWRYKYIARFNGIKDPDYIISGTYITIPAE